LTPVACTTLRHFSISSLMMIFNHDLLAPRFAQLLRDQAGRQVGAATRRQRRNQLIGFVG